MARHEAPTAVTTADGTVWEAPGVGTWNSASDHVAHAVTASMMELYAPARRDGLHQMFEQAGLPALDYEAGFVHGWLYDRLVPLVGGESGAPPPPTPILWVATRVHPLFRRRARTAKVTFGEPRGWGDELARWRDGERDEWVRRNLALTDEDPAALDDRALLDHLRRVRAHYTAAVTRHFTIKVADSVPMGDLLALTDAHGIPARDVVALLAGASPSSGVPTTLHDVAAHVRDAGVDVRSLEDVRAIGPEAAAALDRHLREHGCRSVGGYDVDAPLLAELPDLIVGSINAAARNGDGTIERPDASAARTLHDRVPAAVRDELDRRFAAAIEPYGLRDENGPLTMQWPAGLLRRVLLESGRRLAAAGQLHDPADALELRTDEVESLLAGGVGPSADEAAERRANRVRQSQLTPPDVLGPPDVSPPLDAMPAPLARGVAAITSFLACMTGLREGRSRLVGTGIGSSAVKGRAVVVDDPADAFERIQPGDVLVTTCTTPAYNSVLMIVGGVVTEEGGPLCHAAIMARELGIPAVVGALGATADIADGAEIEVDPTSGQVRVITGVAA